MRVILLVTLVALALLVLTTDAHKGRGGGRRGPPDRRGGGRGRHGGRSGESGEGGRRGKGRGGKRRGGRGRGGKGRGGKGRGGKGKGRRQWSCSREVRERSARCVCPATHYGKYCTKIKCAKGIGKCAKGKVCLARRFGERCVTPSTDAKKKCSKSCGKYGACVNKKCVCGWGRIGDFCEKTDPCKSPKTNTCKVGRCKADKKGKVQCGRCGLGSSGDTCSARNFCLTKKCQHGGTCLRAKKKCKCRTGYEGDSCEKAVAPCKIEKNAKRCKNGGKCTETKSKVGNAQKKLLSCTCKRGFYGSRCTAEDKCNKAGTARSFYTRGSAATCCCKPGYSGRFCNKEATGERATSPCTGCTKATQCCVSGTSCKCLPGWRKGTGTCNKRRECTKNKCKNGGRCREKTDGSFDKCICKKKYTSGDFCQKSSPCWPKNPCCPTKKRDSRNKCGKCTASIDWKKFTCDCPDGQSQQKSCEVDACRNCCQNGGACVEKKDGNRGCKCKRGFAGRHCERKDTCATKNPCKNGGTCIA